MESCTAASLGSATLCCNKRMRTEQVRSRLRMMRRAVRLDGKPARQGTRVVILGSTGSIGLATIQVLKRLPGYRIVGLAARQDIDTLEKQVREVSPKYVAVHEPDAARELKRRLGGRAEVLSGPDGVVEVAGRREGDVVVSAMVGSAGLKPTYEAVRQGKRVAIANKETLVVGGELIARAQAKSGAQLLPVDSEHSAIFQCLEGQERAKVRRVILTASGGPFRRRVSLAKVTVREALRHPTWRMGRKITIDSATLMNKGLEIIEAKWLFNLSAPQVEVLIHPQSIVHSLVEFVDGSVLAQMGLPDMKLPIQYALTWPTRVPAALPRLNLAQVGALTFEPPNLKRFLCLKHAREAAEAGGSHPVVLNAANEVAVQAFLNGRIRFTDIPALIGRALDAFRWSRLESLEHIMEIDREARAYVGARSRTSAAASA